MDFAGKVFIVTGASSGIGHACAGKLLECGAHVVGFDKEPGSIEHERFIHRRVDIGEEGSIISAVDETLSKFGQIDGLVNCAGIFSCSKPFYEIGKEEWEKVISTNLTGTFFCAKHVARAMKENRAGKIVNTSCIRSKVVKPQMADYAASKGGVTVLTAAMAMDLAPYNIQVNAVAPGFTLTGMTQETYANPDVRQKRERRIPVRRIAMPADIANAVLFLLSDSANYITGETIFVDGCFAVSE